MWEYITIVAESFRANGGDPRVVEVNGESLIKETKGLGAFFSKSDESENTPKVSEYLSTLGQEGWELVSTFSIVGSTFVAIHFYFKRRKNA